MALSFRKQRKWKFMINYDEKPLGDLFLAVKNIYHQLVYHQTDQSQNHTYQLKKCESIISCPS